MVYIIENDLLYAQLNYSINIKLNYFHSCLIPLKVIILGFIYFKI